MKTSPSSTLGNMHLQFIKVRTAAIFLMLQWCDSFRKQPLPILLKRYKAQTIICLRMNPPRRESLPGSPNSLWALHRDESKGPCQRRAAAAREVCAAGRCSRTGTAWACSKSGTGNLRHKPSLGSITSHVFTGTVHLWKLSPIRTPCATWTLSAEPPAKWVINLSTGKDLKCLHMDEPALNFPSRSSPRSDKLAPSSCSPAPHDSPSGLAETASGVSTCAESRAFRLLHRKQI